MDDSRHAADLEARKRLQIQRRAKRGLIAGYIHSLSARHAAGAAAARPGSTDVGSFSPPR
jgi:hypothetical protein